MASKLPRRHSSATHQYYGTSSRNGSEANHRLNSDERRGSLKVSRSESQPHSSLNRRWSHDTTEIKPAFIVNNPSSWKPKTQKSSSDLWKQKKAIKEEEEPQQHSHGHALDKKQPPEIKEQIMPQWKKKLFAKKK